MPESKSTVLLEEERADRFGKSRSGGYVIWSRNQGDKIREIKNEQDPPTEEETADAATDAAVEDKFNSN